MPHFFTFVVEIKASGPSLVLHLWLGVRPQDHHLSYNCGWVVRPQDHHLSYNCGWG